MIQKLTLAAFSLAIVLAAAAFAADADKASDPRLELLHDVDHPWSFESKFTSAKDWEKRAEEVRRQIMVAEGLWPMPAKTPLNAVIHGRIERDGYTIEKVFFASMPGHYVSGNLYRPTGKSGKLPAVLSPHGHWANGRMYENSDKNAKQQIEEGAEKTMEGAKYPLQARCAMLARMGCIVFFYDMVGYADSTVIQHREGFTDTEAALRLQSFMGLQSWNSIRALDFLASLPDVDPSRIAVTGASGGGTQTMILCGIDPRPAVSFPAVMVSTAMQGGCICENSYYLRLHTNNVEFASLFAPKPLGMSSANDWTKELLTKGFPQIKAIYGLYGAQDKTMAWYRSFEHNYNQVSRELMYNWMNEHLKLGLASPVEEKPFVPVPPKELSVYNDQHPRPADFLDAMALRKKLTEASDAQLAELAKNPEDYRKVIAEALAAMVRTAAEDGKGDIRAVPGAGQRKIYEMDTVLSASGAHVRSRLILPARPNGTVIIWADPRGTSVLTDPSTQQAVEHALNQGAALLAADLLMSGSDRTTNPLVRGGKYAGYTFSGYYYGYNAPVLAYRVNDVIEMFSDVLLYDGMDGLGKVQSIRLLATGRAGPWALLANALMHDLIDGAAIDLNHFDFDQVRDPADEMMLPGALKYGGVAGFASLCTHGKTMIWNAPSTWRKNSLVATPQVSLREGEATLDEMIDSLLH
jgi:dienelactone hydrolase